MLFNWYARQNCILADEMGLGKTVQSIGLFLEVMVRGEMGDGRGSYMGSFLYGVRGWRGRRIEGIGGGDQWMALYRTIGI